MPIVSWLLKCHLIIAWRYFRLNLTFKESWWVILLTVLCPVFSWPHALLLCCKNPASHLNALTNLQCGSYLIPLWTTGPGIFFLNVYQQSLLNLAPFQNRTSVSQLEVLENNTHAVSAEQDFKLLSLFQKLLFPLETRYWFWLLFSMYENFVEMFSLFQPHSVVIKESNTEPSDDGTLWLQTTEPN